MGVVGNKTKCISCLDILMPQRPDEHFRDKQKGQIERQENDQREVDARGDEGADGEQLFLVDAMKIPDNQ